ncbi:MAG: hypothetical protein KDA21_11180 [Phycisphaerales bacterium]|nr:hypothetical protein [Phycisphaerales bacterium]
MRDAWHVVLALAVTLSCAGVVRGNQTSLNSRLVPILQGELLEDIAFPIDSELTIRVIDGVQFELLVEVGVSPEFDEILGGPSDADSRVRLISKWADDLNRAALRRVEDLVRREKTDAHFNAATDFSLMLWVGEGRQQGSFYLADDESTVAKIWFNGRFRVVDSTAQDDP